MHLKAIRWKTPFEAVRHAWTTTPEIFKLNPCHLIPGPNKCLVPKSRDATLTREAEEALWHAVFTVQPERRREFEPNSKRRRRYLGAHIFDRVCNENGIQHKLTKPPVDQRSG